MCKCTSGNGCRYCYPENLYETQFYCKYVNDYLYLEDVKSCDYFQEIMIPTEEQIQQVIEEQEGVNNV